MLSAAVVIGALRVKYKYAVLQLGFENRGVQGRAHNAQHLFTRANSSYCLA